MDTKEYRTRNFATLVYPESAPVGWMDILDHEMVPYFISPLHNQDVTEDGGIKKEHYHVMIMFDNVKTTEQAREVFDKIGGVGCEKIKSLYFYARYLCHLDHPDKAQYSVNQVKAVGKDYYEIINSPADDRKALKEIQEFIRDNDINLFCDLCDYALQFRPDDWFKAISEHYSYYLDKYIKSLSYKNRGI